MNEANQQIAALVVSENVVVRHRSEPPGPAIPPEYSIGGLEPQMKCLVSPKLPFPARTSDNTAPESLSSPMSSVTVVQEHVVLGHRSKPLVAGTPSQDAIGGSEPQMPFDKTPPVPAQSSSTSSATVV